MHQEGSCEASSLDKWSMQAGCICEPLCRLLCLRVQHSWARVSHLLPIYFPNNFKWASRRHAAGAPMHTLKPEPKNGVATRVPKIVDM